MVNKFLTRSGWLHTLEQVAVILATLVCAAWYQYALHRMDEAIEKPKILIETLATPTVLPTLVDPLTPSSPGSYAAMQSATATLTSDTMPQPQWIPVVTATPTPPVTPVTLATVMAKQRLITNTPTPGSAATAVAISRATSDAIVLTAEWLNQVTATPEVPPMKQIYTPVPTATPWPAGLPTPTIDPNDPLKLDPMHIKVIDALDSVTFTMLPVVRDTHNHQWIFRWQQAWAPPVLEPEMPALPGSSPYKFHIHFVIRPYPFDPMGSWRDAYSLVEKNEVTFSDMDLVADQYAFAVRGEFECRYFNAATPWSEWRMIDIKK